MTVAALNLSVGDSTDRHVEPERLRDGFTFKSRTLPDHWPDSGRLDEILVILRTGESERAEAHSALVIAVAVQKETSVAADRDPRTKVLSIIQNDGRRNTGNRRLGWGSIARRATGTESVRR